MAQLGPFLRKMEGGYGHWCPGCHEMHYVAVEKPLANGARWSFDGNIEAPTFSPSVKIAVAGDAEERIKPECCHYFVRAGEIQFCSDSTHQFAGQTVPLPAWPESG